MLRCFCKAKKLSFIAFHTFAFELLSFHVIIEFFILTAQEQEMLVFCLNHGETRQVQPLEVDVGGDDEILGRRVPRHEDARQRRRAFFPSGRHRCHREWWFWRGSSSGPVALLHYVDLAARAVLLAVLSLALEPGALGDGQRTPRWVIGKERPRGCFELSLPSFSSRLFDAEIGES